VALMRVQSDFAIYGADGSLVALVDARNREDLAAGIAAQNRRNLIVHGMLNGSVPYFLMVSQDYGYLWDQRAAHVGPESPPTTAFSMKPIIVRYLPSLATGVRLTGTQFELAVAQWLSDLTAGLVGVEGEPEATLSRSDFLDLIQDGRVETALAD
jgi:hypothetical protein